MKFSLSILLLISMVGVLSCNKEEKSSSYQGNSSALSLVVTTGFIYDIVSAVVGDKGNVIQIIGSGTDPHSYTPTRSDIVHIAQADVIFYNGLHLEGNLFNVFERLSKKKSVYSISSLVPRIEVIHTDDRVEDPHIWMNALIWRDAVLAVQNIIVTHDPNNATWYTNNATSYATLLEDLHDNLLDLYAHIPRSRRILITSHDAFNYFGRAYGFEVYGIQGVSTIMEASLKTINTLIELVMERGVGAIFVESSVSSKYVQALIEGAENRGYSLKEGGVLYADSLGIAGERESTYIGMMEYNALTIVQALTGMKVDYVPLDISAYFKQ